MKRLTYNIEGFHITQDKQYGHLRTWDYPALGYAVIYPTVEAAEEAILGVFGAERAKLEKSLAARQPHPDAAKKAWNDKIGAFALIEERISKWEVFWSREKRPGCSTLSHAAVQIALEQRVAWREVRQVTRTTESGLEAVHELCDPGPWSEWHVPIGGATTYLPDLSLDVVPWTSHLIATRQEARAWMKVQLGVGL